MALNEKHCVPCEGGIPKMTAAEVARRLPELPGWEAREERLSRLFKFKDFVEAMKFVNQMAEIAGTEGHHPDFSVHYNQVEVTLWTHAVGGLSENDFILAAKINSYQNLPPPSFSKVPKAGSSKEKISPGRGEVARAGF